MNKEEFKKLNREQMIIAFNQLKDDYSSLFNELEQEKEKYKRLSIEAQATAFEDDNIDTEGLLRVLLKQGEITLNEKGEYQRKDFDWEDNLMQLGLMKKREKTFYIPDDECLDEYTKQLESQLKEYNELKRIFREKNITNETMYDGFCRLYDEVENLKQIEQLHQEENGKLRVELEQEKEKNKAFHKFIMFTGGKDIKDFSATEYMRIRQEGYIEGRYDEQQKFEEIIVKNYISKDKIRKFIKEELPEEEVCNTCEIYDVNGISIKEKLEKILTES